MDHQTHEQQPKLHQYQANCCKTRAYPEVAERLPESVQELQASYKTLRTAEDSLRNEDLVLLLPLPAKSLGIYFALLQQHQKGMWQ